MAAPNDIVEQAISEQYVTEVLAMMKEETGWKQESSKEKASVYSRPYPNTDLKAFKVEATLEGCSVQSLVDLLHNQMPDRHKEWNDTYKSGAVLEKIDDNKNVQSWVYHVTGLKDREFVVARKKIDAPDGVIMIDKSIDFPGAPENPQQAIRCKLPFNVRYIKPLESGGVHLTYMNLTDLAGKFPHWLLNRTNASVSLKEIKHIKQVCQADTAKAKK